MSNVLELSRGDETSQNIIAAQTRFIRLFCVVLLIAFSPSKALGLISPYLFIVGMLFYVRLNTYRYIIKLTIVAFIYSLVVGFYWGLYDEFLVLNAYFLLITLGPLLVLCWDFRPLLDDSTVLRLRSLILTILILEILLANIQGLYGFLQYGELDGFIGDMVQGTIRVGLGLEESPPRGGNVFFVLLITTLGIFIVGTSHRQLKKRDVVFFTLFLLAWIQASVFFSFIYLALAALATVLLLVASDVVKDEASRISATYRFILIVTLIIGVLGAFIPSFLPSNTQSFQLMVGKAQEGELQGTNLKYRAAESTFWELSQEEPLQPWIGLGPGQYSSRAALIVSGEYLSTSIFEEPSATYFTEKYILRLNRLRAAAGKTSSTEMPFFSWLSLYGEFGLLGVLVLIWCGLRGIRFFLGAKSGMFRYLPQSMVAMLIYLAALGVHENYWEWTQGVFPGFLLLALSYQYLKKQERSSHL